MLGRHKKHAMETIKNMNTNRSGGTHKKDHRAFYIAQVKFENIQCFETLATDFTANELPLKFSLLLGDNSTGKTTYLRCLAIGLCDKVSATTLLGNFRCDFVRIGHQQGIISIDLHLIGNGRYRIVTTITGTQDSEEIEKELYYIPTNGKPKQLQSVDFPWNHLFVCGYGAGRVLGDTRIKYDRYRLKDTLGTLFCYDQPMQDPELSLRRVASEIRTQSSSSKKAFEPDQITLRPFLELIKDLFMFRGEEHIELTGRGIEIVTPEGRSLLQTHGDGYKNTSAWVLDLITWNMLAGRDLVPTAMTGIVLIDEIEQHLHPKWQRYIIQLLKKQFPGIQFVAATHSPLCVSGITDLEEDEYRLLRFNKSHNQPVELVTVSSLSGLRADQLLTSEAFDLPTGV